MVGMCLTGSHNQQQVLSTKGIHAFGVTRCFRCAPAGDYKLVEKSELVMASARCLRGVAGLTIEVVCKPGSGRDH